MSDPIDRELEAHRRWAAEARRRGRSIARIAPFTPPTVRTPRELWSPMDEPTVEPQVES